MDILKLQLEDIVNQRPALKAKHVLSKTSIQEGESFSKILKRPINLSVVKKIQKRLI
jgi:hypothetical protein